MIIPKLKSALAFGGDYNPEQWPESVWQEDMRLMRDVGVNLLTLGVFSWSKLQLDENRFDFGWLDRVMDLLAANEIFVDLATATASPPPWLSHRYPDVLAVDANGAPFYPGSRQHYSPSSPTYRAMALELVCRLADRYKNHPALAAWHINNEYGNHVAECHSEASTKAFRLWLQRRYPSLNELNDAWATTFWSQRYSSWEEILTPRRTPTFANPAQSLDFKRFTSDSLLALFLAERTVLRTATPLIPVTTNFMGFFKPVDAQAWAREMDFVSWDSYPDPADCCSAALLNAATHDLTRSLKRDRPFLLMEQSVSSVTWKSVNVAKHPGLMRLWSWQALARGADGVMFFQWRASRAGAEKFLGGMLPHVPPERSRTFAEIKALGHELRSLSAISGTLVKSQIAIVFDWAAWWAIEADSKPAPIEYANWAQEIHSSLTALNLTADFVGPGENLDRYSLVIVPCLYLLTPSTAANLSRFVENGGHLLATFFSGIVNEHEQVELGGYPALLRRVLGLMVEEWFPISHDSSQALLFFGQNQVLSCKRWSESLQLEGAESIATYQHAPLFGRPAITVNAHGKGQAYYLSTQLEGDGLTSLLSQINRAAKVRGILSPTEGVETVLREGSGERFLFLLNHNETPVTLTAETLHGVDLVTNAAVHGSIVLPPLGAQVIRLRMLADPTQQTI